MFMAISICNVTFTISMWILNIWRKFFKDITASIFMIPKCCVLFDSLSAIWPQIESFLDLISFPVPIQATTKYFLQALPIKPINAQARSVNRKVSWTCYNFGDRPLGAQPSMTVPATCQGVGASSLSPHPSAGVPTYVTIVVTTPSWHTDAHGRTKVYYTSSPYYPSIVKC